MSKTIKGILLILTVVYLMMSMTVTAFAAGNVTYAGSASGFIFEPGSEYSPTDLFTDLKNVMPGDCLTQEITVKNDVSNKVKVNIYMRSRGAHKESIDFLSKLHMTVDKSADNEMAYMFDAAADQTDGLNDWVLLGTLYSGGEVDLEVTLEVPIDLDNEYQEAIGYLDWQFKVEEMPTETGDPIPPKTGDVVNTSAYLILVSTSGLAIHGLWIFKSRKS